MSLEYNVRSKIKKLTKMLEEAKHSPESILAMIRLVFSTVYYMLDNTYWAYKMGIVTGDTARVNRYRVAFWLITTVLTVPPTVTAYLKARRSVKKEVPKTQLALRQAEANAVRVGADLLVSSSYAINADVIPAVFATHEGLIGLAGVVSGASGLYTVWNKY